MTPDGGSHVSLSCVRENQEPSGTCEEVFDIDGRPVRVEQIPAIVCTHCGEPVFSRDATERVRRMVHGEAKPITSIQMDVFAYR
jgi:YgiT-type zinc finger domain-containing protein